MADLPEKDVEALRAEVDALVRQVLAANSRAEEADTALADLVAKNEALLAERDAKVRRDAGEEALTDALHPEFGYEWREPMPTPDGGTDGGGTVWKAIQQAKAEAEARWMKVTVMRDGEAIREAQEEAWNACATEAFERGLLHDVFAEEMTRRNPYRKE